MSKFHFARVFSAHYQSTPVQYVWRMRLEHAARAVVLRRDRSITEIAMSCGFSSSQTFSRAFTQRFRASPRALRKAHLRDINGFSRSTQPVPNLRPTYSNAMVTRWERCPVRIEHRPAQRVAYIRHIGPYWNIDDGIGRTFAALERWARAQGLWSSATEVIGNCLTTRS